MSDLAAQITALWESRDALAAVMPEAEARDAVNAAIHLLDSGEGRVADGLVPVLDRQLAGDDRRAAAVSIFEDFEQVANPPRIFLNKHKGVVDLVGHTRSHLAQGRHLA